VHPSKISKVILAAKIFDHRNLGIYIVSTINTTQFYVLKVKYESAKINYKSMHKI